MAPTIPNFYRGDTVSVKIQYTGGIDITGWIFTITLKTELTDAAPALQVQQTASGVDAAAGVVRLVLTSVQTAPLSGWFYLDIERRIPGSPDNVRTIIYQKIKVVADVTA
jgi:hypothetical protein